MLCAQRAARRKSASARMLASVAFRLIISTSGSTLLTAAWVRHLVHTRVATLPTPHVVCCGRCRPKVTPMLLCCRRPTGNRIDNGMWEQNNDDGWYHVTLPFDFNWFGATERIITIGTNGVLTFGTSQLPYGSSEPVRRCRCRRRR
jgi:hypothetical protein